MLSSQYPKGERRTVGLMSIAALVVIVAGMRAASTVLVPLVFALFLAVLLAPLVHALQRLRIPPAIGIPAVVLSAVALLVSLGGVLGQTINALVDAAPSYEKRANELLYWLTNTLGGWGFHYSPANLRASLGPDSVLPVLGRMVTGAASILSYTLLVLVIVVFLLFDAIDMPNRLELAFRGSEVNVEGLKHVAGEVKKYIVLKTYMCLLTGTATWIVLYATGVDFAPLWALLAVVFGYIPTIGALVSSVPPVILAVLQLGPGRSGLVLLLLVVLNVAIGNFLEPQIFGKRLGLSTLAVFVSLVAWGWLWGPAGMLLSVPLTMVTKILLDNSTQWRWLGALLEPSLRTSRSQPPTLPSRPRRP